MRKGGDLVFITGGARSGKSSYAEDLAGNTDGSVLYIATCVPRDQEMVNRVKKHRERRPTQWETAEVEKDVAGVIRTKGGKVDVILLDCLTLLVTNLYLEKDKRSYDEIEGSILSTVTDIARLSLEIPATVIIVSNEVGMGLVPDNPTGREFRDILGRANQIVAKYADKVYLTVAGLPVLIKGESC